MKNLSVFFLLQILPLCLYGQFDKYKRAELPKNPYASKQESKDFVKPGFVKPGSEQHKEISHAEMFLIESGYKLGSPFYSEAYQIKGLHFDLKKEVAYYGLGGSKSLRFKPLSNSVKFCRIKGWIEYYQGVEKNNKAELEKQRKKVEEYRIKAEEFKGETLVFKGLYLGMPPKDAEWLLNYYIGNSQKNITTTKKDISKMYLSYLPYPPKNEDDKVVLRFMFSAAQLNTMFKTEGIDSKKFMSIFCEQYKIKPLSLWEKRVVNLHLPPNPNALIPIPLKIGEQIYYEHRDDDGFKLKFWGKKQYSLNHIAQKADPLRSTFAPRQAKDILDAAMLPDLIPLAIGGGNEGSLVISSIESKKKKLERIEKQESDLRKGFD